MRFESSARVHGENPFDPDQHALLEKQIDGFRRWNLDELRLVKRKAKRNNRDFPGGIVHKINSVCHQQTRYLSSQVQWDQVRQLCCSKRLTF